MTTCSLNPYVPVLLVGACLALASQFLRRRAPDYAVLESWTCFWFAFTLSRTAAPGGALAALHRLPSAWVASTSSALRPACIAAATARCYPPPHGKVSRTAIKAAAIAVFALAWLEMASRGIASTQGCAWTSAAVLAAFAVSFASTAPSYQRVQAGAVASLCTAAAISAVLPGWADWLVPTFLAGATALMVWCAHDQTRWLRRFRNGDDGSQIPTALGDGLSRLWYVNDAFLRFWGYESLQSVQGRWLFEFLDDPEQYPEIFCRLRSGGPWEGYLTARRLDSSPPVRVYASAAHAGESGLFRWTFVHLAGGGQETQVLS